ncbi:hypothetical protein PYV02_03345 [Leifsonia sp. H3M29-4]|uniref:hypothetical protein n=1 Tax=Salinibacterium metalliresistens TaxID=3031321 RepID=UPI0023DCA822|nr:hypothetical protein [Salinibacterium metalliresistens]MDF1478112.1 hypothetical protein [Salinibacterium metalliresistens]
MTTLIEKLAQSVPSWGAKLAYGDKSSVNGQDVIPVAFVIFGFGGGEGSGEMPEGQNGPAGKGEGSGGGGGGYALPIGAYVGTSEGLRFQPNPVALAVVAVPLVSAIGWALSRIIRASH